jgi:hypothetical protein
MNVLLLFDLRNGKKYVKEGHKNHNSETISVFNHIKRATNTITNLNQTVDHWYRKSFLLGYVNSFHNKTDRQSSRGHRHSTTDLTQRQQDNNKNWKKTFSLFLLSTTSSVLCEMCARIHDADCTAGKKTSSTFVYLSVCIKHPSISFRPFILSVFFSVCLNRSNIVQSTSVLLHPFTLSDNFSPFVSLSFEHQTSFILSSVFL